MSRPKANHIDTSPIGDLLVSDVLGSLGPLFEKTMEWLAGEVVLPDGGATSLIERATQAWKTPFGAMTCEQLRLLLSQDMGTPWVAPIACLVATRRPNATVTFYPGDLTRTILRAFPAVFEADAEGARSVLAGDFGWIEQLRQTDAEFGATEAADIEELLKKATALASAPRINPVLKLSNEVGYDIHTNRELGMMLRGVKPLAVFSDGYDHFPDAVVRYARMFDRHVALGRLVRRDYVELWGKHATHVILFATPSEEWRIDAMLDLRQHLGDWNIERERLQGALLGYTDEQNEVWIARQIASKYPWTRR